MSIGSFIGKVASLGTAGILGGDTLGQLLGTTAAGNAGMDKVSQGINFAKSQLPDYKAMLEPYINAGTTGATQAADLIQHPDQISQNPAIQSQFKTGFDNMQKNYAASGKLMSGQAMKDLYDYSNNFYQTAINNAVTRATSVAGIGTQATGQYGNVLGSAMGNVTQGYGNMGQIAYNAGMAPANFLSSAMNSGATYMGLKG